MTSSLRQVLLIDDEPVQLKTRGLILRGAGFEICIATTAESALALLRSPMRANIGVIVTDHILPGASGAVFVRELRRANAEVPVIVITGLPEAETEYAELNVIFRQKPLYPEELISLVRAAVHSEVLSPALYALKRQG